MALLGGAIYAFGTPPNLTVENVIIRNNQSPTAGGGIYLGQNKGSTTLRNITFSQNSGSFTGGALLINFGFDTSWGSMGYVQLNVENLRFYNNTATSGAAIANIGAVSEGRWIELTWTDRSIELE